MAGTTIQTAAAHGAATIACVAIAAGCGGDSGGGGDATREREATAPKKAAAPAKPATPARKPGKLRGLRRPLYPRCGTAGLRRQVGRLPAKGQRIWQLTYQAPGGRPISPRQTTLVLVIQQAPSVKRTPLSGSQTVEVAGRRVSLRGPKAPAPPVGALPRPAPGGSWIAVWRTKRAYYTAIANGTTSTRLKRLISCLP